MKLPNQIKYAGLKWKVEYVDIGNLDESTNWGKTDLTKQIISINKQLTKEKQEEILVHELLHIALRYTGMFNVFTKEKDEEQMIRAWSLNIYGMLKENKLL